MKILLIDDEPLSLKLLSYQLSNLGYTEVHAHAQARAALSLLDGNGGGIDLIFSDLQMPDMDGIELVRHLAELRYAGELVLISGEDPRILQTASSLARAHRLRVLGALVKPVTPDQLRQVLGLHGKSTTADALGARPALTAADVAHAISAGELVNFYEPKIDLRTGAIVGAEALVRWLHPVHGLIYPGEFIRLAETSDLIGGLTRFVLVEALQELRRWHDRGLDLSISVNISMANLDALDFPDWIAEEARGAGVPLSHLTLELTESRVMRDPLLPLDILARLRLKQIGLSIDDFGTGHSSLAQLRDIPFDEIKIDRGFVHRAATDPTRRAIFEGSVEMARKLGMRVVAEGVEVAVDWQFARSLGCDYAQGYLIGRAMPASDFGPWIAGWADRYRQLQGPGA